jgi:hypothetical protein
LEEGQAQEHLQVLQARPIRGAGQKIADYPLDFLALGEDEFRAGFFFFAPAAISWRVLSMICWAYCSVNSSKRL